VSGHAGIAAQRQPPPPVPSHPGAPPPRAAPQPIAGVMPVPGDYTT